MTIPLSSTRVGPLVAIVAAAIAAALATQVVVNALGVGAPLAVAVGDGAAVLAENLVVAATIVAAIALAAAVPGPGARTWRVAIGIAVGAFAGAWLVEAWYWTAAGATLGAVAPAAVRATLIGWVAAAIVARRRAQARVAAREVDERIAVERLALAESEAHLAWLRSQVEPHFLFNTLATIQRLQRTDVLAGRDALAGFIDYLCGALPLMAQREVPLGAEIDLVAAYLAVIRTRMGERLATRIDVPDALRAHAVPPFAVATLVENAIKHGLSPQREPGSLTIRASARGDRLTVRVEDTGVGLSGTGGSGSGLAQLRARLDALHGTRASLRVAANRPSGVVAEIAVPLRGAPA